MLPMVRAIGYGEIDLGDSYGWGSDDKKLSYMLEENIKRTRFVSMRISSKEEVFDALKLFFNIDGRAYKKDKK